MDLKRPSVREGSGEEHARTAGSDEGFRGSDVRWIREQWSVSGAVAHACLTKLRDLGASRREAREYLEAARRGTHPVFAGLEKAEYPLGAACSEARFGPWRESRVRARPPRDVEPRGPFVAADEVEALAELAKRAMRGT